MHRAAAIRVARTDDAGAIATIYAPHVAASPTSFETEPPDASEIARRIHDTLLSHVWLVFDEGGVVGGYAYATKHRVRAAYQWSVEVSVYVAETCRRRRIAQALYTSLFRILIAQGYVNAYAGITLPNAASVALHQSVGFTPIGVYRRIGYKMGAWHDVGWWELALQPHVERPRVPHPIGAIATASLDSMLRAGLPLVRAAGETV